MKPRSTFYYEARITFGVGGLLPLLVLPAYAWFHGYMGYRNDVVLTITQGFELILPLVAALASAHLMTAERAAGFDELRSTYPEHQWCLPALRTAGALGWVVLAAGLGACAFRLTAGTYPLGPTLLPAIPPTLWLLALSLLIGNVIGNPWAAAGVTMGYWLVEIPPHIFTVLDAIHDGHSGRGLLFLFARSWPPGGSFPYAMNRWLLTALGLAALWANGLVSVGRRQRPRWG